MPKPSQPKRKALFLDRDGTLVVDEGYVYDPNRIQLLPRVRETLQYFLEKQWLFFLFSNQSGVGYGYYTLEQAQACTQRLIQLLDLGEHFFTKICLATETPEQKQVYRKPSPRFILECVQAFNLDCQQCWMIGDKLSDVQAGLSANIHAALLTPNPLHAETYKCFEDLYGFKEFLAHQTNSTVAVA
ncbi:MAG: HAD-IIIA family hydrolase [Puniceicoccales bacterium]|jgi:D-glycero-D-manno-heptose 1,7-bisphosphate phosphatase|nr:HAD-IIIA family hydrolase [Puniceicoccales bacterium]